VRESKPKTIKIETRPDGALTYEVASQIVQFDTRKNAEIAARELPGWGPSDVIQVRLILGLNAWTIADHHLNALTRKAWAAHVKKTVSNQPADPLVGTVRCYDCNQEGDKINE